MRIETHGQQLEVTPALREYVDNKLQRIDRHFDQPIEIRVQLGLRKPDPQIYLLMCEALAVAPAHCVFLDDLGVNLKPARTLGMHTIKVDDPDVALAQLQALVGFPLDADA